MPLPLGQGVQRRADVPDEFALDRVIFRQKAPRRRLAPVSGVGVAVGVHAARQGVSIRGRQHLVMTDPRFPAPVARRGVLDNPEQPGAHRRAPLERIRRLQHLHPRLLHGFFGDGRRIHHGPGEIHHGAVVVAHQAGQRNPADQPW